MYSLTKATEHVGWKWKHSDRCGSTYVSLQVLTDEDKVLRNERRKPSLCWPVVRPLYISQDTVCLWGFLLAHSASLGTA